MPRAVFMTAEHCAPYFAAEVLSPEDRMGEVEEKTKAWLDAGLKLPWIVNPKSRNVTVFRSLADVEVKAGDDVLDGEPVVPGFRCTVDDIFRPLN